MQTQRTFHFIESAACSKGWLITGRIACGAIYTHLIIIGASREDALRQLHHRLAHLNIEVST